MSGRLTVKDLRRIVDSAATMTENEFWARKAQLGEPMKPLGRPCHDCAVTCGFYSDYSDRLALQPPHIRESASLRWSCHNNPDRACRGNIDRLSALPRPAHTREDGNV